jgi:hypothetical protein
VETILHLFRWFWRAWPVLILGPLFYVHLLLLSTFSESAININKIISLICQVVGGIIILYTIDSNIDILKHKSLFSLAANYLKEFPLIKRHVKLEVQGGLHGTSSVKAKISVVKKPESIEERIAYLQEQINDLKLDLEQKSKELSEKIDGLSYKMSSQTEEIKSGLQILESKIVEISTGGITVQLFGVLLMVYGAIAGFLV